MMAAAAKNTEATASSASGTVELALAHVSIARDRQTRGMPAKPWTRRVPQPAA